MLLGSDFLPMFAGGTQLDLASTGDLVAVGPYDTAASGTANWGAGTISRDFITLGQRYRIRQAGQIRKIRLYCVTKVGLSGFYFTVWRKNGNYDLVDMSANLLSSLAPASFNEITLPSAIGAEVGDYYGYRMEKTSGNYYFSARTAITGVATYYVTDAAPVTSTDFNWAGQTGTSGVVLPIEIYMEAPTFSLIGDSIIAGHPANYSFLETTATTSLTSTIAHHLVTNHFPSYPTYQNMGIGSQTTTSIAARFAADVIAKKPRVVVIDGGVNDVAGGVITEATFLANWTTMLDACQAESSVQRVVVIKILPWKNGTNTQMQTRDTWLASLSALVANYSKARLVDASSLVGQFRVGGDAGNLWDIQTAYNADGVHFNSAGHALIAQAVAAAVQ